jgi:hypothetical protein
MTEEAVAVMAKGGSHAKGPAAGRAQEARRKFMRLGKSEIKIIRSCYYLKGRNSRKTRRGRIKGVANRGNQVSFGIYGLKSLDTRLIRTNNWKQRMSPLPVL